MQATEQEYRGAFGFAVLLLLLSLCSLHAQPAATNRILELEVGPVERFAARP